MRLAVVGGGILGRLAALMAADRGCEVSLFSRYPLEVPKGTSYAAGGMLAPIAEAAEGEISVIEYAKESFSLWREILQKCNEKSHPTGFATNGSLILAHARDYPFFDDYFDRLRSALSMAGIRHDKAYKLLDGAGVNELEPKIASSFQKGLFFPNEGHLNPAGMMACLLAALKESAVKIMPPGCYQPAAHKVYLDDDTVSDFDCVLDCRGYSGAADINDLRGVRGEALLVRCKEVHLSRPLRLLHPRYHLYIIPRPNNHFYLGATSHESSYDGPITVESTLELLSALYSINPAFGSAEVLESYVGVRPAFPDNLPKMQDLGGLIRLNGLYRHGYLLAPCLVKKMLTALSL